MTGMLDLRETAEFYFDEEAADRPCRFIEKFCTHYEGRHAGKPFILHPVQRRIVRDIFGWKWRGTGLRRFTDVYLEGAVGCGKSPLLAAIGLYGLIADGEPAAQIYSLASTFGQARVVFDTAKRFVRANTALEKRLDIVDREIRHPRSGSIWQIVSGKGPGAGCKPHMILGDEVHQWGGAGAYQDLRDRMFKRQQPMMIVATNAGDSQASFCWTLREKAVAALEGHGDPTLYPVIWAASEDAATDDPEAWRQANPLLGTTIEEDKVRLYCTEAMKDPEEEANFRRLYLGIWPKAKGGTWLDLAQWDECVSDEPTPEDAETYVGLDLSQGDDLCAAAFVGVTPERFYIVPHFWLPRVTAEKYEAQHGIPYRKWAKEGHITLLDEPTISSAVRQQIAQAVIARHQKHPIKSVCYDRYKADETVAALEAAGLTCVPIPQGYTLSPGCMELDRRIKERSIVIASNPVLRWCAENTEVKQDDRGNIWPVKPNARGKYAGTRGLKIDGITATVTALVEARKHSFPEAQKLWKGQVCIA